MRAIFLGPYVTRIVRNSQRVRITERGHIGVQEITVALMANIYQQLPPEKRTLVERGNEEAVEQVEGEATNEPVGGAPSDEPSRLTFEK